MVLRDDLWNGRSQRLNMSPISGESSWLYGARIGQFERVFDLTGLEPTHRMNSKLV
jgi:hypothetical protein